MFDFQKEVVLNSLDSVKKFENGFRVDGMLYKNEYVGPVYKTEAVDGAKAKLVIDLDKVKGSADAKNVENVMQFVIELGLDNDYRGDFGSVLFYFRKPIVVTMDVKSDVDTVAKAFEKAGVVDYKLYNVSVSGNKITLEMTDNYITVRKAEVMDLVCDGACGEVGQVSKLAYTFDLKDSSVYTKNNVGFGTYDYMIHNLRLPTYANIRFASPAESEMPVKGGKYTQYSFEYTVPRRLGGLSVAGQKTESTTIHTFFVLSTAAANFEKFLDKVTIKSVTKNENGKVSFDHTPDTEMHENLANGVVSGKVEDVVIDNE